METIKSSEEVFGGKLLHEVEESEESVESLLNTLTTTIDPHPSRTGIPDLDSLWSRQHTPKLSVSGRSLPLLCHILHTLLAPPKPKTVVLIDVSSRFSPSFLNIHAGDDVTEVEGKLRKEDLKHLHIFRPSAQNLESTLKGVEEYMVYGEHESKGREFGGTILFGYDGNIGGVKGMGRPEMAMGWRGWLRVEKEETGGFGVGMSADEMLGERERRWEVVEGRGWKGIADQSGRGGEIRWKQLG